MARVVGVNIPDNARIEYALTFIYGVGWSRARDIVKSAGLNIDKQVKSLNEQEIRKIQDIIEKNYRVEGDLKEDLKTAIKRMQEIGAYKGSRHARSLPVRGQRTRSNARTKRGKRRTIGAMKKEDVARMQQQKK
ncbi:MAG: 30S ribosomal protein S13 [Candidatus Paceibacterota bacterium]